MRSYSIHQLIVGAAIIAPSLLLAQQEFQFSNTINNPFLLNPAAGGLTDVMHFEAASRMQWVGYEGAPRTIMFSGHSQVSFNSANKVLSEFNVKDEKLFEGPAVSISKRKHIIGGKVWNDAVGPFSKTSVQGSYAYHLPLSKKLNMGVGLGFGFSNFRLNESRVVLYQQDDNTYDQFLGNSSQQNFADAQAGLVVYGEKFFFGLSGTQMLRNDVVMNEIITQSYHARHMFMMIRYRLDVADNVDLEPTAVIRRTFNSPISADFGLRYVHKNRTWVGLQYRTTSMIAMQIGTNLVKNLYLNYGYDLSIGKLAGQGSGTHELQIGYYLGKNRNVDKELKENQEGQ